jgi:hypothetical protein
MGSARNRDSQDCFLPGIRTSIRVPNNELGQGRSEQTPQKPNIEPEFCAVINSLKVPDQRRCHYLGFLIRAGR